MEYRVDPLRRKLKTFSLENERLKVEISGYAARVKELEDTVTSLRNELAGAKMQIGRFRKRNGGKNDEGV